LKKKLDFNVNEEFSGSRIDKYLQQMLQTDLSRSDIKKLIQQGAVLLNGRVIKPNSKVKNRDLIQIEISQDKENQDDISAVDMQLDVIFEDEYLLVVNKPAGVVVHPAAGHSSDTLVNALLFHTRNLSDINGAAKPGIVHRLDKDTSGVLVVAKNNQIHREIARQFKEHQVKKTYWAIVLGSMEYDEGIIDEPISRSPFDRKKMRVCHAANREAATRYKVIKRTPQISLLEIFPETGRTHQIRVHMAHLGHPVLGDAQYGRCNNKYGIKRQALHAKSLGFIHPQLKVYREFEAALPDDMRRIISEYLS